ncbi:16S rRNA (adenine(1518)-N(6)/adenine(1519)-N(6))-dimethyltransferase RsmA [Dichotomicrobium thermohalophilum]|uniref:Ribosomal RNA small subunit methyltransferase A n=1 Tax=Dichotomicrobium thermohalophilum TaxID=933063 RepID=A0A397QE13_9HYPH|nr:16S rRNA (adenine(1518)-N(6)/adenine(1519)-N(6))-dimethyltransferase RsmA [Dichotomicrobium thermohalophilum]RIA56481.1 dimethyladenosine transferase [Dichotomicrobium thermohalophilum]
MSTPDGLPPLREVIAKLGLTARKSLGQNFILDLNLTRRIARAAAPLDDVTVLEIGPGPGGLTRALLLEGAAKVVAIERDTRCRPALEAIAAHYPGRLEIIEGDALSVDQAALVQDAPGPVKVVANLPYSVATPLLVGWLSVEPWPPWYELLCLMFQREVADRLIATPGSKVYGRLSVLAQWRCEVRLALTLPPAAFTPPPKVASAVVTLTPRAAPAPACRLTSLAAVTAAAFGQRRKMVRASLARLSEDAEELLAKVGIAPTARAEQLTVADFARLAAAYEARKDKAG